MKYLKKNKIVGFLLTISLFVTCGSSSDSRVGRDEIILKLLKSALKEVHYNPREINDNLSENIYNDYLEKLDYTKVYLTQKDIQKFEKYKHNIDEQILDDNLDFFNTTFKTIRDKIKKSESFYKEILDNGFDFEKKEPIDTDFEQISFAKNEKQLKNRWRKRLKQHVISNILNKTEAEDDKCKDDPKYIRKNFEQIKKEEIENVRKSYKTNYKYILDRDRKYWLSVFFNSFMESFDPHTSYFAPKDKDKFDESISGKFEGIGARLQDKDGFISIVEIIVGGPAYKQKELEADDKILKVAQGEKEPVDIAGFNINDAVKMIKGKKGTVVKLTVKKTDGSTKVIAIERDIVEIEETFAKSSVVEFKGKKYGIINLPGFYFDIKNGSRDCATDIAKEIEKLKRENVEGIALDLRNNGGGSLGAVVKMAGLFIEKGPVVQVKNRDGDIRSLKDRDSSILWDKPLVIMINEFSASASEILAGAMQDYKRAIIVGSNHTYGKGTVQSFLNLDRGYSIFSSSDVKPLGFVKMTIQKFYRINGSSTQKKGVVPDIIFPSKYEYSEIGEKYNDSSLKWDKITSSNYDEYSVKYDLNTVKSNSLDRIKNNPYFKMVKNYSKWIKDNKDSNNTLSLKYTDYKKYTDSLEAESKKFDAIKDYKNKLKFSMLKDDLASFKNDTIMIEKRKNWHKNLTKDAYINEVVNILSDTK